MISANTAHSPHNPTGLLSLIPFSEVPNVVLVVDDDPVNLFLASAILEKCGCTLLKANGPKRAIELFEQYGLIINLLITDVCMPEMAGTALAEHLRRSNPQLPVLCMSAASGQEVLEKGFCFIEKPFTVAGFIQGAVAALHAPRSIRQTSWNASQVHKGEHKC
jgi:CheY-like chemotaxis protein